MGLSTQEIYSVTCSSRLMDVPIGSAILVCGETSPQLQEDQGEFLDTWRKTLQNVEPWNVWCLEVLTPDLTCISVCYGIYLEPMSRSTQTRLPELPRKEGLSH